MELAHCEWCLSVFGTIRTQFISLMATLRSAWFRNAHINDREQASNL